MKKINVDLDEITQEISELTDYAFNGESTFTPPVIKNIPKDFNIGLIVGPSGSGKSTLLEGWGAEEIPRWHENKAIASHFSSAQEAQDQLSAVGLNSVPSWLRPFHVLSTGEKFRANLSRKIKDGAVIDEFTSVVDRNVAKSCAFAMNRFIKKNKIKNVVFATCHYDVADWLMPDWVFDTSSGILARRGLERRPTITLDLLPCDSNAWSQFSQHHYLNADINRSSRCWLAIWNGTTVGFASSLAFPSGSFEKAWREHRIVVLPDYQGLGLGTRISDAIAQNFIGSNHRYFSKTAHPRLGEYREHSIKWKATTKNKQRRQDYKQGNMKSRFKNTILHADRFCYSHEYIGEGK